MAFLLRNNTVESNPSAAIKLCRVYWTVNPRKQKLNGVALEAVPGATRLTVVMEAPDVNELPLLSQHAVFRLDKGIVFVVGLVDDGR